MSIYGDPGTILSDFYYFIHHEYSPIVGTIILPFYKWGKLKTLSKVR